MRGVEPFLWLAVAIGLYIAIHQFIYNVFTLGGGI